MCRAITAVVCEVDHHRGDELGVHRLAGLAHDVLGHTGAGDRCDGIDGDAVAGALDGEHVHHSDQPHFGCAIVGLSEVSEKTSTRGGLDDTPVVLLAHDRPDRPRHVEGTGEVDGDHGIDLLGGHVLERGVAQDACVIHQDVHLPERVHRRRHDRGAAGLAGDRVAVGDGDAPRRGDLVDHALGRRRRGATAVHRAAQIIDHDAGSPPRELQCVATPESAACAGDDGYLVVESH